MNNEENKITANQKCNEHAKVHCIILCPSSCLNKSMLFFQTITE